MSDAPKPNPSLAEISHLFLSSVRERQTGGAPKPVRRPPGRAQTVDLTPEELAQVIQDDPSPLEETTDCPIAPVSAIIGGQLNGPLLDRARQYAAHLAKDVGRVGLIQVDSAEFRVLLYERGLENGESAASPMNEGFDARRMSEALAELAWDVDRWLLVLTSTRSQEARSLLKKVSHWVLLSTSDSESVVTCYRTLKGFSELHRPRLSVAFVDAGESPESQKAFRKLNNVTQQFLGWPIEQESPVLAAGAVSEHQVIACCGSHDKAQLAAAPQWEIVTHFIARARSFSQPGKPLGTPAPLAAPAPRQHVADIEIPDATPELGPAPVLHPPSLKMAQENNENSEVYDLPNGDGSSGNITGAVLASRSGELIECPLKAPMCPQARLAVRRDRRLVLLAVARQGLNDLRDVGQAYQWLVQNRPLIAMALPQLAIDAHQMPQLDLLVDHQDMSADILQPMLQSAHVRVHAYRKLRWGEKTGLLLEAA